MRYPQSLSHRRAYGRQRTFLGWTVGNHAVVLNSDRQPVPGVGPAQRATSAVMPESTRVIPHGAHAGATSEVQAPNGPMMRYAVHRIVITRGTGYVECSDPVLRKQANPVQLTEIGQHCVEPSLTASVHYPLRSWNAGSPNVRTPKHFLVGTNLRRGCPEP